MGADRGRGAAASARSAAALGILVSRGIIFLLTSMPGIGDLAGMGLSELRAALPVVGALGFGVALLLGLAAGFVPAFNAYRSRITDMLRTV